jgi:putative tricarboxylic transport membrane protein
MEANMRRALTISDGDWTALFASPLSITLWAIASIGFVLSIIVGKTIKRRMHMPKDEPGATVD